VGRVLRSDEIGASSGWDAHAIEVLIVLKLALAVIPAGTRLRG